MLDNNFIDLWDDFPSIHGKYDVMVMNLDDDFRYSKAIWKGNGFVLFNDSIEPNEYVMKWRYNDILIKSIFSNRI